MKLWEWYLSRLGSENFVGLSITIFTVFAWFLSALAIVSLIIVFPGILFLGVVVWGGYLYSDFKQWDKKGNKEEDFYEGD